VISLANIVLADLAGTCLYLSHLTATHSPLLTDPAKNKWVYGGNVLVDPVSFDPLSNTESELQLTSQTAEIDPTADLGPNVVIGPGVKIGAGVRLQRCVIMSNAVVRDHAWIANSIVGWNSNVGRWVSCSFFTSSK
jgi:mannose-1-phosphate guanylyltransferase